MADPSQLPSWYESGSTPDPSSGLRIPSLPYPGRRGSAPGALKSRFGHFRRLSSFDNSKTFDSTDDLKGPTGLNLLYEPSEPRFDIIFVHGLGGGSRKTWSASADLFWPKQWLPYEIGFKHARIHSFGYDADWSRAQPSNLTVHDFGQALLSDISNSPHLKKNLHLPIVFVAHSMGGLVVKKAYLLATRDPLYLGTASRIHSLYFLGTPHRGADSAQLLSSILSLKGTKAFVKDLVPGSGTLQAINDEFRHVCKEIQVWSFFEGAPTSGGPTHVTIVDKDSAVLDLPGERKRYLYADHRNICKYASPDDPNYITLLRCLQTTVDEIEMHFATQRQVDHKSQMKLISKAFENAQKPEGDLLAVLDKRHEKSCVWLTGNVDFHLWLGDIEEDDTDLGPLDVRPPHNRILWISGPPGSGKSVLAGHVINYVEDFNSIDCAYFFFKRSSKATITQLLLSLAFQMAEANFEVRMTFLAMIEDGNALNSQDHSIIWNSLFLGVLLKIKFPQPQVWVIDALDECVSRQLPALIQMLSKIDPAVPLKIFLTSRPSDQIERLFNQENVNRYELHTGGAESLDDISAFLHSRLPDTAPPGGKKQSANVKIMHEVLEKSNGIFLWASLIVGRLEETHTVEKMQEVLNQVPSEMNGLYQQVLESIKSSSSAQLAHCILKWVVCSPQPLSTAELEQGVRLDINQTLRASDKLPHICGNLITVDSGSRMRLMHQTVKDFLISSASGVYINGPETHARLASTCLEYLNDEQFTPHRPRRQGVSIVANVSAFDDYAFNNFSYHLAHCSMSTSATENLSLLAGFANGNWLTWIERIAKFGRLSPFQMAIENLRTYLVRYANDHSPLEPEHQMLSRLVDDFARLVAIFGPILINTPSSISKLIPIICPTGSLFHQKFGKQTRQKLICNFNELWDERLSCLPSSSRILSVACNDQYLALGSANGTIRLHRASTFELVTILQQGEPVRRLTLGNISNVLLSGSPRKLISWDLPRARRWSIQFTETPLSLCLNSDESKILVPIRTGVVLTFRTSDGKALASIPIQDESSSSDSDDSTLGPNRGRIAAHLVRLSPELDIMGVSFRNTHLTLCYIESDDRIGVFEKEGYEGQRIAPQILDIVFSSRKDLSLAATAYQDGELVTFDPFTRQQRAMYNLHCHTLASSPDGRTLGAGDNDGVVSLFQFETLRLTYRISTLDERIMGIVFASSNIRLFDIRGNGCNVWEPSVLIRAHLADDSSSNPEEPNMPVQEAKYTRHFEYGKAITKITQAGNSNYLFCGREDGTITYHDIRSGRKLDELRFHARTVEIQHLEWHAKTQTLFSVDASGRCLATRFSASSSGQLQQKRHVFDHRAASTVRQAIMNEDASSYLLSTNDGEELWDTKIENFVTFRNSSASAQWLAHPTDTSRLLLIDGGKVSIFLWKGLTRGAINSGGVEINQTGRSSPSTTSIWFSHRGMASIVTIDRDQLTSTSTIYSLNFTPSQHQTSESALNWCVLASMPEVKVVLGIHHSALYFLNRQGWICSLNTKSLPFPKSYTQHFFIPPFWQIGSELVCRVLSSKNFAFAFRDELVVFSSFLELEEKVALVNIKK
ncbi:putative GPI inositol-deacylase [Seiridium unicorne]|uniref:GPI inositol-deacylase n=1 Tax=Seiridium unicorne TaxID=138068 RepID=A0ABR2UV36_9PEZI